MNEYLAVTIPTLLNDNGDLKLAVVEDPTTNNKEQGFNRQDKCCWCATSSGGE